MTIRSNTIEFIKKSKLVHGETKYNYSLTNYFNTHTKVKLICPVDNHGIFEQTPANHIKNIRPTGCPKCAAIIVIEFAISRRSNTIEFITKAKFIHIKIKYDYSLTDYTGSGVKVKIICPFHGIFEQTPNCHLSGKGCQKCARENQINKQKYNTDEFIVKAQIVHYDKNYDYSLVDYTGAHNKVKIGCPQCHLNNKNPNGCPKCAILYKANKLKSNTTNFIIKAKLVYGDTRYDYSLVDYFNSKTKVKIKCPIDNHGIFEQIPNSHLIGQGCSLCLNKNEAKTLQCLKLLFPNIEIHYQYKPYLNKKYEVDFYFVYNGKIYIVEYNGIQHYELAMHFYKTKEKAEKALIKQQNRDQYGRDQCKENNYNLIEIDCREVSFNQISDYLKNIFENNL